ncbi:short-subunit dehydrogenase [Nitrobacteraceae bacterium AZCC 1564]
MSNPSSKGAALITGSSSGIGAIYADRFARRGYDLILVARDKPRLESLAARLAKETGRKIDILPADLNAKADLLKVEDRLKTDATITALVNNAGVGATKPLVDSDVDQLDAMIQLNVTALTRLTRAAAPGFVARGNGVIINISSIAAIAPELLNGSYGGTKAYVVSLTQSLNHEIGGKGVQVQAVLPGATRTEFWSRAGVPVEHLPQEIVMSAEEMVDAALAGFDQRELITIPSLPDASVWETYDTARKNLGPYLSRTEAASRYKLATV